MLHLRAPPTRRAHLYANANDLCLIYPAVWHFFFLSLSSEKVKLLKDNYCNICHSRSFPPPHSLPLQHRGRVLSINCIICYQSFLQESYARRQRAMAAPWEDSRQQGGKKKRAGERKRDLCQSCCRVGPWSSPSIRGGVKMREWVGAWGVAVGCLHCTPLLQMDGRGVLHIKHCSLSRNL